MLLDSIIWIGYATQIVIDKATAWLAHAFFMDSSLLPYGVLMTSL